MKFQDLRAAWRTDFILHRFDAELIERDDCLVVRTPANPNFYWGNFLALPHTPADGDLAHWLGRFNGEVAAGRPEVRHVAFAFNSDAPPPDALPSWRAAGFERYDSEVLALQRGELQRPPAPRGEVLVRPVDWAQDLPALVELQCTDTDGHAPAGYRRFRERQMARYAAMQRSGIAEWFGVWCDGVLAADCGLLRDGEVGRFQHVETHPDWRRRGLCRSLVAVVCEWGFANWDLQRLLMKADPDDVAIGIYRSVGFQGFDRDWALQRRAPDDGGLAVLETEA